MHKPTHHFFVCASYRTSGEAKGLCHRKESMNLVQYLQEEVNDRGMDAIVSTTGCLKLCTDAPVVIQYPEGHWYRNVSEEAVDEILDAIEEGGVAEQHLLETKNTAA